MFNLGVPAQQIQSVQQTNFSAVVLSALSFALWNSAKGCRCHHSRNPQLKTENREPIIDNPQLT